MAYCFPRQNFEEYSSCEIYDRHTFGRRLTYFCTNTEIPSSVTASCCETDYNRSVPSWSPHHKVQNKTSVCGHWTYITSSSYVYFKNMNEFIAHVYTLHRNTVHPGWASLIQNLLTDTFWAPIWRNKKVPHLSPCNHYQSRWVFKY